MKTQTYKMEFGGSTYRLGRLDAEQIGAIRALIQAVTFQPADRPIDEANRWVKITGDAGPVVYLDRRAILGRTAPPDYSWLNCNRVTIDK